MENIIGLIVFVIYIAIRSQADRKKGMTKGKPVSLPPVAKSAETSRPVKPAAIPPPMKKRAPVIANHKTTLTGKIQREETKERKPFENVREEEEGSFAGERPILEPAAGMSYSIGQEITADDSVVQPEPVFSGTGFNLRQAVAWSVILDKPRCRRGYQHR